MKVTDLKLGRWGYHGGIQQNRKILYQNCPRVKIKWAWRKDEFFLCAPNWSFARRKLGRRSNIYVNRIISFIIWVIIGETDFPLPILIFSRPTLAGSKWGNSKLECWTTALADEHDWRNVSWRPGLSILLGIAITNVFASRHHPCTIIWNYSYNISCSVYFSNTIAKRLSIWTLFFWMDGDYFIRHSFGGVASL